MVLKHKRNLAMAARPEAAWARPAPVRCGLIAMAVWLGFAAPGFAALGRGHDSIEADRAHLAARSSATVNAAYTVHVMTLPNGGTVKEFERSDGVVFALAWSGPSRPDLRQLLGSRFDVLQSDIVVRNGRRLRAPLADERSDFVLRSAGHSGAFVGAAYLPQMAPAVFSVGDLH
jgi:hypothetical protein